MSRVEITPYFSNCVFFNSDEKVIAVLEDQMPSRNHVTMVAITIIVEIVSSIPTCMQIPAKTGSIVMFSKKLVYICFFQ